MNTSFAKVGASILAATVALSAPALAQNTMVGGAEMLPTNNIVENAVNSADHTTLVAAVQAAGLAETLSGPGPFTVFAPTNAAFEKLPDGTVEGLLEPESLEALQTILTCHVVPTEAFSTAVGNMIQQGGGSAALETVGSCTLTASIRASDNALQITDENGNAATVLIPDVDQSNGVIHVIDTVLLPAA
ncbi:fasciclin domain-containing protein [Paracoccus liaowanqingii]|uniref:Fasciclin domain-containing protein n=2 Tax=Paracoccus liaowanqingii TaxID=2560053 RepID=A0A4P7HPD0_9RHOB|nr:fasciclin domain-containing protein [Paracoccus liaowanqingii]